MCFWLRIGGPPEDELRRQSTLERATTHRLEAQAEHSLAEALGTSSANIDVGAGGGATWSVSVLMKSDPFPRQAQDTQKETTQKRGVSGDSGAAGIDYASGGGAVGCGQGFFEDSAEEKDEVEDAGLLTRQDSLARAQQERLRAQRAHLEAQEWERQRSEDARELLAIGASVYLHLPLSFSGLWWQSRQQILSTLRAVPHHAVKHRPRNTQKRSECGC